MAIFLSNKQKFILAFSLLFFFIFGAVFLEIMDEIWREKQLIPFDILISHWMATNQEPNDRLFFLAITDVSEGGILAVLTMIISAILWYYRYELESVLFLCGFGATGVSITIIKFLMHRIRPEEAAILNETSGSFPSAHAGLSLFFFGFFAYILSRKIKKEYSLLVFIVGILIAFLIGFSRVYLNAHWTSDVLGGFVLAAAFLSLCIGFMQFRDKFNLKSTLTSLIRKR